MATVGARGVVLCAAALGLVPFLLLAGCSAGPVEVEVPETSGAEAAACRDLLDALPDEVAGEQRREVTGATDRAAAWGDPPVVLRCGVPLPADFTRTATCIEANGTGWYVPDTVLESDDDEQDVTMTAVGVRPRVEVVVPGDYRPDGFTSAAGRIGRVVADRLDVVRRCR